MGHSTYSYTVLILTALLVRPLQEGHGCITSKTRSSADADKPARRVWRSVKVTKHSTIPYVRYSFLLCSNFVFKMRSFYDIQLQKCRDLEIRVRGRSTSLKAVPFNRMGVVSHYCSTVTLSVKCTILEALDFKNTVTLKPH